MKRNIFEAQKFSESIDDLLSKRKLLREDFNEFKRRLVENPDQGELISGTGGIRKTRLKSSTKGKKGGFRVCYFYSKNNEELLLISIYPKNRQEDVTPDEKKAFKALTTHIKRKNSEKTQQKRHFF
jgi:hypothetical protein